MINGHADAYVQAAIDGEVARMSSAREGERNQTLFKAAAALASLGVKEGQILHHLKPAAEFVGLRGSEFYSTAKSGVKRTAIRWAIRHCPPLRSAEREMDCQTQ
jgi:hypothetical protein